MSDNSGNAFNYAADATKIYILSSNSFTSVNTFKTGTDVSFSASAYIVSTSTDLSVFGDGQTIEVTGSSNNSSTFVISGAPTSTKITTTGTPAILAESAGASVTIRRIYTTGSDENWEFAKWGNKVIATNFSDPVQVASIGAGGRFADLAGSPPKARHIAVCRDFVMLGNVNDGTAYPYRLHWSAIGSEIGWTPGTNLSDYQDLYNGGAIQKILGGEYATVFCEKSIYRLSYEGLPVIFRVDEIEPGRGTPAPNSVVQLGNAAFYLGLDDFYYFDGIKSSPIGVGRIAKTFYADLDQSYMNRIVGAVDVINSIVFWSYPGEGNVSGLANKIIAYNYAANKWAGPINAQLEWLFSGLSEGVTLDGLVSLYGSLDDIPISLDSRYWSGGSTILSAFDSTHKLAAFTGDSMTATIETGEYALNPGQRSLVFGVRPLFDGNGSATAQVGSRNIENDSVTWSAAQSPNSQNNYCNFRANARYHRFRVIVDDGFTHLFGVDVKSATVGTK
jgi:hypothetical protein